MRFYGHFQYVFEDWHLLQNQLDIILIEKEILHHCAFLIHDSLGRWYWSKSYHNFYTCTCHCSYVQFPHVLSFLLCLYIWPSSTNRSCSLPTSKSSQHSQSPLELQYFVVQMAAIHLDKTDILYGKLDEIFDAPVDLQCTGSNSLVCQHKELHISSPEFHFRLSQKSHILSWIVRILDITTSPKIIFGGVKKWCFENVLDSFNYLSSIFNYLI